MKRIFSKKSGFTLVEIIVAFAIFAIMSTMILSMVDLTVKEKGKTSELANSIDEQTGYLTYHYIDDDDAFDSEKDTADGMFSLNFVDSGGNSLGSVSMDYITRSAVDGENSSEGINYFIGKTDYLAESTEQKDSSSSNDAIGNSQQSRYDTRITGSNDLAYIKMYDIWECSDSDYADEYTNRGMTKYYVKCSALGNESTGIADEDLPYLQYKIRFCDDTYKLVEGTDESGKSCQYKVYDAADIVTCGYVKGATEKDYKRVDASDTDYPCSVMQLADGKVRIATKGDGFDSSVVTFYVVFKGDPFAQYKTNGTLDKGKALKSFGTNGTADGTAVKYTAYPIYRDDGSESGKYNQNIYGASPYEKITKAGS